MSDPVAVPRLGTRMRAGLVAEWYQPDGATVERGDPVCRLECDYVAVDVEANASGVLRHRMGSGLVRPPGDLIGVILAPGERAPEFEPVELDVLLLEQDEPIPATDDVPTAGTVELRPADWVEPKAEPAKPRAADPTHPARATVRPTRAASRQRPAPSAAVVPFPKRFASFEVEPEDQSLWDAAVPGDSAEFDSSLLTVPRDAILEAHVEPKAPGDVAVEESGPETAELADWLKEEPPKPAPVPVPSPAESWDAWESEASAASAGRLLSMSSSARLAEAHKMREQLGREWRAHGIRPALEDIAVRAVARALRDLPGQWTGNIALRSLVGDADSTRVLEAAASRPFRDAVLAMQQSGPGPGDCVVTSHLSDGVETAIPRLRTGNVLAVALGAERNVAAWDGDRLAPTPFATLTIAYDPAALADTAAARFLSRVRELIEAPYALLAD